MIRAVATVTVAILATTVTFIGCEQPAIPPPTTAAPATGGSTGGNSEPSATPTPTADPRKSQASCENSAIRLVARGPGIHGAIVDDTLHMGGATAPATCDNNPNYSIAELSGERREQVGQSSYNLIVIRYPAGNRLYVLSRRGDGTTCMVNLDDECIAEVSGLPSGFDLGDLPDRDWFVEVDAKRAAGSSADFPDAIAVDVRAVVESCTPEDNGDDWILCLGDHTGKRKFTSEKRYVDNWTGPLCPSTNQACIQSCGSAYANLEVLSASGGWTFSAYVRSPCQVYASAKWIGGDGFPHPPSRPKLKVKATVNS